MRKNPTLKQLKDSGWLPLVTWAIQQGYTPRDVTTKKFQIHREGYLAMQGILENLEQAMFASSATGEDLDKLKRLMGLDEQASIEQMVDSLEVKTANLCTCVLPKYCDCYWKTT